MKTRIFRVMLTLAMSLGFISTAHAQTSVAVSTQITKESDLVSGNKYILQSMASGKKVVVK